MTQNIEIIDKEKFAVVMLNKNDKTFVIYKTTISKNSNIYLF